MEQKPYQMLVKTKLVQKRHILAIHQLLHWGFQHFSLSFDEQDESRSGSPDCLMNMVPLDTQLTSSMHSIDSLLQVCMYIAPTISRQLFLTDIDCPTHQYLAVNKIHRACAASSIYKGLPHNHSYKGIDIKTIEGTVARAINSK